MKTRERKWLQFEDMAPIVPEGEQGNAKLVHLVIGEQEHKYTMLRAAVTGGRSAPIQQGTYTQLFVKGSMVMSDTQMERRSNYGVLMNARGRVLIAGLGVGMILVPILRNPEVSSVTVIEQSQDVIDLVEPHIRAHVKGLLAKKLTVICADIFEWKPPKGEMWSCIYFDIWEDICVDSLEDMAKLHRKFARRKVPGGWMDSWQKSALKFQQARDRRQQRAWGRFW